MTVFPTNIRRKIRVLFSLSRTGSRLSKKTQYSAGVYGKCKTQEDHVEGYSRFPNNRQDCSSAQIIRIFSIFSVQIHDYLIKYAIIQHRVDYYGELSTRIFLAQQILDRTRNEIQSKTGPPLKFALKTLQEVKIRAFWARFTLEVIKFMSALTLPLNTAMVSSIRAISFFVYSISRNNRASRNQHAFQNVFRKSIRNSGQIRVFLLITDGSIIKGNRVRSCKSLAPKSQCK